MVASKHLWHFPKDSTFQIKGINSLKFDSRNSNTSKLVREICQNSCDARDGDNTVRVVFDRFSISRNDFPDVDGFEKTLRLCKKAGSGANSDRTAYNVFSEMEKNLNKEITVLRASDYGTKGACGSKNVDPTKYTPWSSMTLGKGISDKSSNSGGSFGRGKESFFSVSDFHTVFFSTNDIEGNKASIGCSELMSHFDENNIKRDGFGICGDKNRSNNYSIPELFSLGDYFRSEDDYGTDVFIIGYRDEDDCWSDMIAICAIKDFFLKITNNELEVISGDVHLNGNTIISLIKKYMAEYTQETSDLELVLEQIELYKKTNPVYSDNCFDIYLSNSEKQNCVSSIRSGMIIERTYERSPNIVGLLVITDDETSKLLCKCEPTPHDKWNSRGITNATPEEKTLIKNLLQTFREKINELISNLKGLNKNETLDAEGIEKYLSYSKETPDQIAISKKEYAWNPISKIKPKKRKKKPDMSPIIPPQNDSEEAMASSADELNGGEQTGRLEQTEKEGSDEKHPFIRDENGDMKRMFKTNSSVVMSDIVPLCNKKTSNIIECNIMFSINKESEYYLSIGAVMSDDRIAENIPIVSVFNGDIEIPLVDQYHAGPIISKRGQINILKVILNYPTICNITPEVLSYDN